MSLTQTPATAASGYSVALYTLFISLALLVCCSNQDGPLDPQPSADVKTLIQRNVHQWLDFRMDEPESWALFSAPTSPWRYARSLSDLYRCFYLIGKQDSLWDFSVVVREIKGTALYRLNPLSNGTLLGLIMDSLRYYRWIE